MLEVRQMDERQETSKYPTFFFFFSQNTVNCNIEFKHAVLLDYT